jgi:hypothetical protein
MVAFIVMPYFEVGKSRRYADRRVGLTVASLFIAFMLVSNWMGTPEYAVESSPEREVFQELAPQEGPSVLLGVPYEHLTVGTYFPGQEIIGNPHLTAALDEYAAALKRHGCYTTTPITFGNYTLDECEDLGDGKYANNFTDSAMADPVATLIIQEIQPEMVKLTLVVQGKDPWVKYRHADSNYEEECRFVNKDC